MAIRNAAKAIILHEGKVLLNKCMGAKGQIYYDLPGGGQHPYETMEEATETDYQQEESVWLSYDEVDSIDIRPRRIKEVFHELIHSSHALYLGSVHEK